MNFGDNILIICTYQELMKQYRKILKEHHLNIDIEVMDNRYGKDMSKIFEYVAQFQKKGKEVIITRGFLAQQIGAHLPFKVLETISARQICFVRYIRWLEKATPWAWWKASLCEGCKTGCRNFKYLFKHLFS